MSYLNAVTQFSHKGKALRVPNNRVVISNKYYELIYGKQYNICDFTIIS